MYVTSDKTMRGAAALENLRIYDLNWSNVGGLEDLSVISDNFILDVLIGFCYSCKFEFAH